MVGMVPTAGNFHVFPTFFGHRGSTRNGSFFTKCCHFVATAEHRALPSRCRTPPREQTLIERYRRPPANMKLRKMTADSNRMGYEASVLRNIAQRRGGCLVSISRTAQAESGEGWAGKH
jgi:hypothetical protein